MTRAKLSYSSPIKHKSSLGEGSKSLTAAQRAYLIYQSERRQFGEY